MPVTNQTSQTADITGRLGIRQKSLLLIGATLLIFGALSIAFTLLRSSETAYADLQTRADIIAALQARSAAISLFDFDFQQVAEIVKASAGDPDYLASIVRDTKDKVVTSDGDLKVTDGFVEVIHDIRGGASGQPAKIGEYVLRLKTARIDSYLRGQAFVQIGGGIVSMLIIMGILYAIIASFSGPLEKLTRLVRAWHMATTASRCPIPIGAMKSGRSPVPSMCSRPTLRSVSASKRKRSPASRRKPRVRAG